MNNLDIKQEYKDVALISRMLYQKGQDYEQREYDISNFHEMLIIAESRLIEREKSIADRERLLARREVLLREKFGDRYYSVSPKDV